MGRRLGSIQDERTGQIMVVVQTLDGILVLPEEQVDVVAPWLEVLRKQVEALLARAQAAGYTDTMIRTVLVTTLDQSLTATTSTAEGISTAAPATGEAPDAATTDESQLEHRTDALARLRVYVLRILLYVAAAPPAAPSVKVMPVVDVERDQFLVLHIGWLGQHRVFEVFVHLTIVGEHIWILFERAGLNISSKFQAIGVAPERIVRAYEQPMVEATQ